MLNEHGMIFDDGVTSRLGEHHFHMTTTTGGAARVMNWLEEWLQTEWPDMNVYCTSVTEQWAVAAINGPRARELLAGLTDIDLSPEAFPFMSTRSGRVAGVPARVYRISFTGELSYEINVPARYGRHLWDTLMQAGEAFDICPYGTESMHVLRAEKGFIIVGQDTDGTVTPHDVDMDWIVSGKKHDFIGKRSLSRVDTAREGRPQLVGLLTDDPAFVLPEGAHIVSQVLDKPPMPTIGHVTSSYISPNLGRSIALALLQNGKNKKGDAVKVQLMDGRVIDAKVSNTVFVDEKGERARG
jgi:sarcosine oxidase subunit alpha